MGPVALSFVCLCVCVCAIAGDDCGWIKQVLHHLTTETAQGEANLGLQESSLLACCWAAAERSFVRHEMFTDNWTLWRLMCIRFREQWECGNRLSTAACGCFIVCDIIGLIFLMLIDCLINQLSFIHSFIFCPFGLTVLYNQYETVLLHSPGMLCSWLHYNLLQITPIRERIELQLYVHSLYYYFPMYAVDCIIFNY